MKKDIIYPCMIKCALITNNVSMKNLFENLACGRCPPGVTISKNMIYNGEFSYKLDQKKPAQELCHDIMSLFKDHVQEDDKVATGGMAWSQVRKKIIRDTLLERYVLDKIRSYQLSILSARKLLSLLIVGLMFKTISSKNISYHDGFIQHIDGFHYEPKRVIVTKNIFNSKIRDDQPPSIDACPTSRYLSDSWMTYVQELSVK